MQDPDGNRAIADDGSYAITLRNGDIAVYDASTHQRSVIHRSGARKANHKALQSLSNRKPGKTPNSKWPNLPPNLKGKKGKWNSDGYWDGVNNGRYTWDNHSHGAGVERGSGPQDGHWDDENSDNRWDRNGSLLFQSQSSSFTDQISEITGLSGKALAIYLIISEGSRILFPPRNVIPVP